ncbi:MAG: RHS repeat-associated core domain-containing protein, partial [Dehalococcoidia bacterium]
GTDVCRDDGPIDHLGSSDVVRGADNLPSNFTGICFIKGTLVKTENGNMIYRGSHDQELVWDAENRLTEVKDSTSEETMASFTYDGFDDRVFKTEGGSTTLYINPYYEIQNYDTAEEKVVPHYYFGGQEIAYGLSTNLRYTHRDHLGSTSTVTDGSGTADGTVSYYPFGDTRDGDVATEKKSTGQRLDDTGLYYYNARYYDAELGRFISPDTVVQDPANPQFLNRYSYVLNNPLKYTDPSGHFLDTLFDIGSALYDIYTIARDPGDWENWAALGADVGCAFVPFVAGGGVVVRGATKADDAYDVARGIDKASDVSRISDPSRLLDDVSKVRKPNAGGRIRSFVTTKDAIYYRVYSGNATEGKFLTRMPPASRTKAIEGLALPLENTVEFIQEVLVPAGTRLQRSRTLPAFGRRGGMEQFELLENIPKTNFRPGVSFQ